MQAGLKFLAALWLLGSATECGAQELFWGEQIEGLQLGIGIENTSYTNGQPIIATVVVRNITEKVLRLPGYLADDLNYYFAITDGGNQPVTEFPRIRSGSALNPPIGAGQAKTNQLRIDTLFDLKKSGDYAITASREVPSSLGETRISSGKASIRIREDAEEESNSSFAIPNVPSRSTANRSFNSFEGGSAARGSSSAISKSIAGTTPSLANHSPTSNMHSFSSDQKTGMGIIAGLLALLFAILWRAIRRKPKT